MASLIGRKSLNSKVRFTPYISKYLTSLFQSVNGLSFVSNVVINVTDVQYCGFLSLFVFMHCLILCRI